MPPDNSPQLPSRESGITPSTPTMTGYEFGVQVLKCRRIALSEGGTMIARSIGTLVPRPGE